MNSIMTVDLEYDWDSKRTESIEKKIIDLLDFFDDHNIKATFFVVTDLIDKFEDRIKEISKKHEIASHSHKHLPLKKFSMTELNQEILISKKSIEELKIKCFGFRAPFFVSNKHLLSLLEKNGYKYDSSLCPSIFPGRYFNLTSKKIHFVSKNLLEIPVSTFRFVKVPFSLSYSRLFYPFSLSFLPKTQSVFYLHPCEFLEEKPGKEISFVVNKMYSRKSGKEAWKVLENILSKHNLNFVSCYEFIKENYPKFI